MNCESMKIECFFTELEKVKPKIDPVIDKINWRELSRHITIDEAILDYYQKNINWTMMGARLFSENVDLFNKYENLGLFKIGELRGQPSYDLLMSRFYEIHKDCINPNNFSSVNTINIVKLMIADPRFTPEELVEMMFRESSMFNHSKNLRELMLETYGNDFSMKFWARVEEGNSIGYFEDWIEHGKVRSYYDKTLPSHRRAVLNRLSRKSLEELMFPIDKFTLRELIYHNFVYDLKTIFRFVFKGKLKW